MTERQRPGGGTWGSSPAPPECLQSRGLETGQGCWVKGQFCNSEGGCLQRGLCGPPPGPHGPQAGHAGLRAQTRCTQSLSPADSSDWRPVSAGESLRHLSNRELREVSSGQGCRAARPPLPHCNARGKCSGGSDGQLSGQSSASGWRRGWRTLWVGTGNVLGTSSDHAHPRVMRRGGQKAVCDLQVAMFVVGLQGGSRCGACQVSAGSCAWEARSSKNELQEQDVKVPADPGGDEGLRGGSAPSTQPSSAHLRWRSGHSQAGSPGRSSRRGPGCSADRVLCPARPPPPCRPPGAAPPRCPADAGPSCRGQRQWG